LEIDGLGEKEGEVAKSLCRPPHSHIISEWSNVYKKNQGRPTLIYMPAMKKKLLVSGEMLMGQRG
jgi:hypothetical protein